MRRCHRRGFGTEVFPEMPDDLTGQSVAVAPSSECEQSKGASILAHSNIVEL